MKKRFVPVLCFLFAGCNASGDSEVKQVSTGSVRGSLETTAPSTSDEELRELLAEYNRAFHSSLDQNGPVRILLQIQEKKPIEQLANLYRNRDPATTGQGGTYFGIICRYTDPRFFFPLFVEDLDHSDPGMRMYACDALAELGLDDAIPMLKSRLDDDATVPGYRDGRVNFAAACSLAWLGNADGFPVMFEWAERNPDAWEHNVLRHFRRFSDEDFGLDLEAWRKHFSSNPPREPIDESYRWWGEQMGDNRK